jgi:hypothetical protein
MKKINIEWIFGCRFWPDLHFPATKMCFPTRSVFYLDEKEACKSKTQQQGSSRKQRRENGLPFS